MREALLREVRKSFPAIRESSRSGLPLTVVIRWAGAVCLLAIVAGVPWILRNQIFHDDRQQPAADSQKSDRARPSESRPDIIEAPEIAQTPEDELRRGSANETYVARRELSLNPSEPEAEAAGTASSSSFPQNANVFRNVAPADSNILRSFLIEMKGDTVVFADEDGSRYEGKVVPAAMRHVLKQTGGFREDEIAESNVSVMASEVRPQAGSLTGAEYDTAAPADVSEAKASGQTLFFRASGLNKTARKRVVFEGKIEMTEAAKLSLPRESAGRPAVASTAAAKASKSLPQAAAPAVRAGAGLELSASDARFKSAGESLPGSTSIMPTPPLVGTTVPNRIAGNALVNGGEVFPVEAVAQP